MIGSCEMNDEMEDSNVVLWNLCCYLQCKLSPNHWNKDALVSRDIWVLFLIILPLKRKKLLIWTCPIEVFMTWASTV